MTRGASYDTLVVALVLSCAVHIGLMLWAKPQVMTRIVPASAHARRPGPMKVSEAPVRPDAVSLDVLADEPPEKGAPVSDESVDELPASLLAEAPAFEPTERPPVPESPEVMTRSLPDVEAPRLSVDSVVAETPEAFLPAPKMAFDEPTAPGVAAAPEWTPPVLMPTSGPSLAPPDRLPEADLPETVDPIRGDVAAAPEFVPVAEVMPEVDAKVVEQEKDAVRSLLHADDAKDISKVVDLRLATAQSEGYVYFRATVTPKAGLASVPKDVVILIDASGSIGDDRLASCRRAARRILRTCTNTGDRFNLVAFRDRFAYAFRAWRPCDAESFAAGDKWLTALAAHGRTDVFATISSVLTLPRDPTRPLIALVVTDGDANEGVSGTREILSKFARLNDGLVSVYMYGVKASANRELIDVLTRGNRGESFIFEGWRWSAGEGIDALSERFRDPVLTDLRIVFASDCPAQAYPSVLKNLYSGNSVTVIGRVKGRPAEVAFSLKGLAGSQAFEGFYRLPLGKSTFDANLPALWRDEARVDSLSR